MNKSLLIILIMGILIYSCTDIFEEDIENEVVVLLTPSDSLKTAIFTHNFWWEEVDGALKYNLQIVKPSFDLPQQLELDTNITANMYTYQLDPGTYQWRVKAFNGSSETEYSIFSIIIDSTLSLTDQTVILHSPEVDDVLNDTSVSFEWKDIDIAEYYKIIVKKGTWDDGSEILNEELTDNSYEMSLQEGVYSWAVQAFNENSLSRIEPQNFEIDTTAPSIPVLLTPANNSEHTTGRITFTWSRSDDNGSNVIDNILIAKDQSFSDLLIDEKVYNDEKEYISNLPDDETQDFYWVVSSIDEAGNTKGYSDTLKFTIKSAK